MSSSTNSGRSDYGADMEAQQPYKAGRKRKSISVKREYMNLDEFLQNMNNRSGCSGCSCSSSSGYFSSQDEEPNRKKPNVDLLASLYNLGKMIQDQNVLIKQRQATWPEQPPHKKVYVEKKEYLHAKHVANSKMEPTSQQPYSHMNNGAESQRDNSTSRSEANVCDGCPISSASECPIKRGVIPEKTKDSDYWDRRKRNNKAAQKSREERRNKELNVLHTTKQLETENSQLNAMLNRLSARNDLLESRILDIQECHVYNTSSGGLSSSSAEDT